MGRITNNGRVFTGNKFIRPYERKMPCNKDEYIEVSYGEKWHKPSDLNELNGVERVVIREKIRVRRLKK